MDILATLAVIVAGVLIYRAYKFLTIHPYKSNFDFYLAQMIPFAKKFGFNENDQIAQEDIDFRYKHLKALIELNHTSEFRDIQQLETYYDTISRLSEGYEETRKALKVAQEKFR